MYSTTFDRTFGDQHCAGIELIQNGRRVATNGDIHLLPTPEQWDATPPPTRGQRTFDAETGKITVKKGVKKGTYKMTVKVNAAGNTMYKPLARPVTVKIIVK